MAEKSLPREGPIKHVLGGCLCLDFINTVDAWSRPRTRDDLPDYAAVLSWARQLQVIPDAQIERLRARLLKHPMEGDTAHQNAWALRALLYRTFTAIIDREEIVAQDVAALDAWCRRARTYQVLTTGEPWQLVTDVSDGGFDAPMLAVVLSAQELLTSEQLTRVKVCAGPIGCGWLFLDRSKNASRRWCSMAYCGARAKHSRDGVTG